MVKRLRLISCLIVISTFIYSCQSVDLFEKTASIPGHAWKNSFKPTFTFTISDTSSAYDLFVILRHNDKYSFNNIYVNISMKQPGVDTSPSIRRDLRLGTDENGWLGSGMDDIYEHRIPLTTRELPLYFKKPGEYLFTIEQIMRQDPLLNVLNVGLRIEKRK